MNVIERTSYEQDSMNRAEEATICPFIRKTASSILSDLRIAREEIARGEGVSSDCAMATLGERYGFL